MIPIKYKFERDDPRVCALDPKLQPKTLQEVLYFVLSRKHPTLLREIESHIKHRLISRADHLQYVFDATPFVTIDASAAPDVGGAVRTQPIHHGQNPSPEDVKDLIRARLPELLAADLPGV
ncbi:hypothetical protein M0765_026560 [Variovorax sp. S2]|uniref:hypothetical protein n=1 Tax=Variovorax sp. S12S4 TaxID=3029170 RepID=UPI00215D0406|nr:hypothetical protein [Variovorax sp. S12S4]MCR8961162.1 hypothetical protein [Variovorax sp. S12S4]